MNVIIANEQREVLAGLNIDVIKSITGEFEASEIVDMFKNFFFGRMIIDLTAIKNYQDVSNIQKLSMGLDVEKLIFLLPNDEVTSSSSFLTKIISMGIYNFTTNADGINYLLENPNSYKDVAHIQQLNEVSPESDNRVFSGNHIIGFRNVTDHAGATTLIFMLKKELESIYGPSGIYAIEVNRHDLSYFNMKNTISTTKEGLMGEIVKIKDANIILVDLNDCEDQSACGDVLYLVEPSTIKLNKLMRKNKNIFNELRGKRIILSKSMLTNKDVADFEYEAKTHVFYNLPPLDERKKNEIISDFLVKIGLIHKEDDHKNDGNIWDIFKK